MLRSLQRCPDDAFESFKQGLIKTGQGYIINLLNSPEEETSVSSPEELKSEGVKQYSLR